MNGQRSHASLFAGVDLVRRVAGEEHRGDLLSVKDLVVGGDRLKSLQLQVFRSQKKFVRFSFFFDCVEFSVGMSALTS